ncbi:hypothetical protein VNO78_16138 [Psophocarpus tetragonolobus]|uniref:Uncharacterized protein n=1 Tax=Psophocarpus tetragonolobus TaxID=3891 RepID=A0AAN9XKI3_PSOTE
MKVLRVRAWKESLWSGPLTWDCAFFSSATPLDLSNTGEDLFPNMVPSWACQHDGSTEPLLSCESCRQ